MLLQTKWKTKIRTFGKISIIAKVMKAGNCCIIQQLEIMNENGTKFIGLWYIANINEKDPWSTSRYTIRATNHIYNATQITARIIECTGGDELALPWWRSANSHTEVHYNRTACFPLRCPHGDLDPIWCKVPWTHMCSPNNISIVFFSQLTNEPHRQRDRQTMPRVTSVTIECICTLHAGDVSY